MDLIIKPTVRCNFKCTFCSSTEISDSDKDILDLDTIFKFLKRFPDTETIIVNGGDPLMMSPDYYWSIINYLEENGLSTTLSFTSNLWAFYKRPDIWGPLFKHPRMGVTTSFQYGGERLKGDGKEFTEEEFWGVSDLMLDVVGYRPDFIAVITEQNSDTTIKTVELAKAMGVECKVNYAMGSGEPIVKNGVAMGNKDKPYLLSNIYEKYLEIHEKGLTQWEYNTKQLIDKLQQKPTTCPLNNQCDSGIRNLQPSGRYYSCGAFGDDDLYRIDFDREMEGEFFRPLQTVELVSMKTSCFECPMFSICNGCSKTIHEYKKLGLVEQHCKKMKVLAPRLIKAAGMEGRLQPTPYKDESTTIPLMDIMGH